MSLTVCLLTRNEEPTVGAAVRSVRGVADEVLVADTASTDRTAEVAAAAGATVSQFRWDDDFAEGRNYLAARATGDWILWLDAKEELPPESVATLNEAMSRAGMFGFFTRIRRVDQNGRSLTGETSDLRLFRRRDELRFVGRLHPHLDPAVVEAVKREGLKVGSCDVILLNHADLAPPSESKLRWNARLLELELRDRPGQLHYLIEQGRTLLQLKDPRGHASMAAAAEQVYATRDADKPASAKVQVLLLYVLMTAGAQGPLTPDVARELALRWFPTSPNLLWRMAGQRFAAGEFEQAAELLKRLIELGQSGTFDRSQIFERDIVGDRAVLNLGACYLKLGRAAEAEACFVQLAGSPTVGPAAGRQLEFARRMKRP